MTTLGSTPIVYGFALPADTRWWEGLQADVGEKFTTEHGHRTAAISEIMVRAPWRRRGIGRTLHDDFLAQRSERRATLLVDPDNDPAQAAYARWGWQKVGRLRPAWKGAPLFDVMITALDTRR